MNFPAEEQLYQVSGLWCSSCARALQHALSRLSGVERCSVDFVTHTVKLSAAGDGTLESVRSLAEGMGYRIEPYKDLASLRDELAARTRGELMRLAWVGFFAVWTMALALVDYTEAMGPLTDLEFRWLALAMGACSVTGVFGGAWKVYLIGLSGAFRGRPSIDSLLVVTSLSCLTLSFYNLWAGSREVYFDSAIMVIAVVLGIRAILAMVSGKQLDLLYRTLLQDEAQLRVVEGEEESFKPVNAVKPGYWVRICAGEVISVDGRVAQGEGAAQSALFTGEADPVALSVGSEVLAGEILLSGEVRVEVGTYFGERLVDRLSKQALSSFHEEPRGGIVDTVLAKAALILLGLAVASLLWRVNLGVSWAEALPQALSVIIVACPCALFFCRPLPLIRAQFLAERGGVILLRPWVLSRLRNLRVAAFDKTGTLTSRSPRLDLLVNDGVFSEGELWALLAGAELNVQHPIAYAVLNQAARFGVAPLPVSGRRLLDTGVSFEYGGKAWRFGQAVVGSGANLCLVEVEDGREVCVARFGVYSEAATEVPELVKYFGDRFRLALLSGDRDEAVAALGEKLGFASAAGDLNPEDKADEISRLTKSVGPVLYCGDGYNDVKAFAASEVAVCMPHAPAAVRLGCDVQLLRCDAGAFATLFALGRMADNRYRQNLVLALGYNAIAIPAAFAGAFAPWVAAAAMGFATLAVLLNSLR